MTFTEEVQLLLDSHAEIATKQPEALRLLNSVHKALFGSNVKQGCGDCTVKAFTNIRKYIYLQQQKKDFNLETMVKFKDRNFAIKDGKVLTMPGASYTNDNLTDESAVDILTRYPNLVKHFEKYPGSETPTKELDLSLLGSAPAIAPRVASSNAMKAVKSKTTTTEDKVNNPPHKRNGLKTLAEMLPGETVTEYADRIGMSDRNVLRYVAAKTLPNYDPDTKKGKVIEASVEEPETPVININGTVTGDMTATDEVIEGPVDEQQEEAPKTLRELLTPDGLLRLEATHDIDKIITDLNNIEEADVKAEDTLKVAQLFNAELTDEAEATEILGALAGYLKGAVAINEEEGTKEAPVEEPAAEEVAPVAPVVAEQAAEAPAKPTVAAKVKSDTKTAAKKTKAADAPEGPATV